MVLMGQLAITKGVNPGKPFNQFKKKEPLAPME